MINLKKKIHLKNIVLFKVSNFLLHYQKRYVKTRNPIKIVNLVNKKNINLKLSKYNFDNLRQEIIDNNNINNYSLFQMNSKLCKKKSNTIKTLNKYKIECNFLEKKLSLSKDQDVVIGKILFINPLDSDDLIINNYNQSANNHYVSFKKSKLYNSSTGEAEEVFYLDVYTSIKKWHIYNDNNAALKLHNYSADALKIIKELSKYDTFLNTTGDLVISSMVYDRSICLYLNDLQNIKIGYPLKKKDNLFLDVKNSDKNKHILINNNCYSILDSNGNCKYSHEMLNFFKNIKLHDTDTDFIINNISDHVKKNVSSSFSNKNKLIFTDKEDIKDYFSYLTYSLNCIQLEQHIAKNEAFIKYIKEADKLLNKTIENNNSIKRINISGESITDATKTNVLVPLLKNYKSNTSNVSIEINYKKGDVFKYVYNEKLKTFERLYDGIDLDLDLNVDEDLSADSCDDN